MKGVVVAGARTMEEGVVEMVEGKAMRVKMVEGKAMRVEMVEEKAKREGTVEAAGMVERIGSSRCHHGWRLRTNRTALRHPQRRNLQSHGTHGREAEYYRPNWHMIWR